MLTEFSKHLDSIPFGLEIEKKNFWEEIVENEIDAIKKRPKSRK